MSAAEEKNEIILNFVGADIPSVVKTVGMITGKNFILDPRVTGTINIVSAKPVARELVYPILLSALRMQGFTAIEGPRGVIKILPEADAKLTYSPTITKGGAGNGDRIVTRVYPLLHESAVQLVPVLRPLIAPNNVINAYPNSNTLVITDYAENLKRIDKIISSIDVPAASEVQVLRLQHASAFDVSQLLTRLIPEASVPSGIPGGQPKLVFAVDSRTNSLIVRADTNAMIGRVRSMVQGMDIPSAAGGNIRVVYLRNAEANKVAETLRAILSGVSSGAQQTSAPAVPGQPGQPVAAPVSIPSSAGGGSIQPYPATNSLVITAPDFVYNSLRDVIEKLDARRAQVFVEALIAEVSTTTASEFGIQWQDLTGINSNDRRVFGGTNFGGAGVNINQIAANPITAGNGLNVGLIDGKTSLTINGSTIQLLNLGVLARALESEANANILSTPNLLTIDNEEAKIVVGQNVPFVTGSFSQATGQTGAGVNPFQTIERRDVGLTLKVTPTVAEGGTVKLKIFQEVSSLTRTTNISTADVVTNKRSIESTVLVDDRQIVVLGGLIEDDVQTGRDKVPLLGDIPLLGNLFRYDTRNRVKRNLMVFIRPVVLRDNIAPGAITHERYEYIRNEQTRAKVPKHIMLPDMPTPELPPFPPPPAPTPRSEVPPANGGGSAAPPVSNGAGQNGAPSAAPQSGRSSNVNNTFSDNLMLSTPPAKKAAPQSNKAASPLDKAASPRPR